MVVLLIFVVVHEGSGMYATDGSIARIDLENGPTTREGTNPSTPIDASYRIQEAILHRREGDFEQWRPIRKPQVKQGKLDRSSVLYSARQGRSS